LGTTGDFCEKTKNNFSINEPIPANNILIDAAGQAATCRNLKNLSNLILVEQAGNFREKITTLNNVLTVPPTFTINIPIDSG
jgi:hypothetical protein